MPTMHTASSSLGYQTLQGVNSTACKSVAIRHAGRCVHVPRSSPLCLQSRDNLERDPAFIEWCCSVCTLSCLSTVSCATFLCHCDAQTVWSLLTFAQVKGRVRSQVLQDNKWSATLNSLHTDSITCCNAALTVTHPLIALAMYISERTLHPLSQLHCKRPKTRQRNLNMSSDFAVCGGCFDASCGMSAASDGAGSPARARCDQPHEAGSLTRLRHGAIKPNMLTLVGTGHGRHYVAHALLSRACASVVHVPNSGRPSSAGASDELLKPRLRTDRSARLRSPSQPV